MRRKIGKVVFETLYFNRFQDERCAEKLFKKIGANALQFEFKSALIRKSTFYRLIGKTVDLTELEFDLCEVRPSDPNEQLKFECKNLETLVVKNTINFNHLASVVPDSLKNLTFQNWSCPGILNRQKSLKFLRLGSCFVMDFDYSTDNCNLKELYLNWLIHKFR
jgi:hypothetical protein